VKYWISIALAVISSAACSSGTVMILDAEPRDAQTVRADSGARSEDAAPPDVGVFADAAPIDAGQPDAIAATDAEPADAVVLIDSGPECVPDLPCLGNLNAPCMTGRTSCTGNATTCVDDLPAEDGTACGPIAACVLGECSRLVTVSNTVDISTASITPGRTCAESPQYSVVTLSPRQATLGSTPGAGCFASGDELLLINLQGTASSTVNVGNWELLRVDQLQGSEVRFTTDKTRSYGSSAGSDLGIGSGANDQKVALIRVPRFGVLHVGAQGRIIASAWNGTIGGVLALRAGVLELDGALDASTLGYRSGAWSQDDGDCDDNVTTEAGESITGLGGATTARNAGGAGGIAAADNIPYAGNTPISATAGHSMPGNTGINANRRMLGEPGATYGSRDGTKLTLGSGGSGGLTCVIRVGPPFLAPEDHRAGGIVLLSAGRLTVRSTGVISATPIDWNRDIAASGGYVLIRGGELDLGDTRVTARGAVAHGGSAPTAGIDIEASPGYVVIDASRTVTGTTSPPAILR
jgi:hypothetical protein